MNALVDLDRMRSRLAELDAEREPLLALIRAAEAYETVVGRTLFAGANVLIRHRAKPDLVAGRAAPIMEATERAVAETLELLGPLNTSELTSLLSERPDLRLAGDNATNVLSARLSNSQRFKGRRGVGWWFADRNWPDAADDKSGSDSPNESGQTPE